ncbi:AAA family ATPase [Actinomycetospora aeridis]|uniref:AAA family ATPase n=1 Tax=Actinomycetospora aeridis TaxID=3129231 RepID=A0ABU8N5X7_9PSEU
MVEPTGMFRVFVSSTFQDMADERRALAAEVFGPLADLCAAHGTSFQAVDLRWGVDPQAGLEQRTMPICLAEVRRCLDLSPRLNLLVLLGDQRGWLPLPTAIPLSELDVLREGMSVGERRLLDEWYVMDANAAPAARRLVPRTGRYVDAAAWLAVERALHEVFRRTVPRLPAHRHVAYVGSAVEQELAVAARDPEGTFAVVRRTAPGLDGAGSDALHLERLEAELRGRLGPERMLTYTSTTDDGVAGRERVLTELRRRMQRVIESAQGRSPTPTSGARTAPSPPGLIGRDAEITMMTRFARDPTGGVLGLVGEAGVGKSTLLSAVATSLTDGRATVVLRLLGTTAATGRLEGLLRDLIAELASVLDVPVEPAGSVAELVRQWVDLLGRIGPRRPLLLVLDAVDQLDPDDEALGLVWLPDPLPPHVSVIMSTLPGPTEEALHQRGDTVVRHLDGLSIAAGRVALRHWLAAAGRTVTPAQEEIVIDSFRVERRPLWLRMAVERARGWDAARRPSPLPPALPDLVRQLFDQLAGEAARGPVLARRAVALLAASDYGLAETDMLDLLSADPEVMTEVRARAHVRWRAEIVTLPTVLWAQLRADLQPYLTEREVEGEILIDFYHRTLREVASLDLLSRRDGELRHRQLAAHFTRVADPDGDRTWRGARARAFGRLPQHLEAAGMWPELARTLLDLRFLDRTVALVGRTDLIDRTGRRRTVHGGVYAAQADLTRLQSAAATVLDPADRALGATVSAMLGLEASLLVDQPELLWQQLSNRLRWDAPVAAVDGLLLEERRRESEGLPPWLELLRPPSQTPGLRHVLREQGRAQSCALSPDGRLLVSGGDEDATLWDATTGVRLAFLTGHGSPVRGCAFSPDGNSIFTADDGGTLRRWSWDGLRATVAATRHLGHRELRACAAAHGQVLVAGRDGLWLCARDDLSVLARLDDTRDDDRVITACAVDENGRLAVAGYVDGAVRAWRHPGNVTAPRIRDDAHQGDGVYGCAVDATGSAVLTAGQDGLLRRWDNELESDGDPLVDRGLPKKAGIWACAASRGLEKAVTALVGGAVQSWDTAAGIPVTLSGHANHIAAVSMSGDGTVVASAGVDGTVRLWDPSAAAAASVEPYSSQVQALALAADGRRVLAVDAYGIVRTSSTSHPAAESEFDACERMCVDGSATPDLRRLVVVDWDGTLRVWDLDESPHERHALPHEGALACVVTDERTAVSAALDGTVHGWDIDNGRRLWTVEIGEGVPGLEVAADGRSVLAMSGSGTVRLVDPRTGGGRTLRSTGDAVNSGAFGPGGAVAVGTAAGDVLRWELRRTGAPPPVRAVRAHAAQVLRVTGGSPETPFCSSAADGTVALWSARAESAPVRCVGHDGPVRGAAVDARRDVVYTAGNDNTLRAWSSKGRQRAVLPIVGHGVAVRVHPGTGLVACADDGGFVQVAVLRGAPESPSSSSWVDRDQDGAHPEHHQ